jgi:hypothetical protein
MLETGPSYWHQSEVATIYQLDSRQVLVWPQLDISLILCLPIAIYLLAWAKALK